MAGRVSVTWPENKMFVLYCFGSMKSGELIACVRDLEKKVNGMNLGSGDAALKESLRKCEESLKSFSQRVDNVESKLNAEFAKRLDDLSKKFDARVDGVSKDLAKKLELSQKASSPVSTDAVSKKLTALESRVDSCHKSTVEMEGQMKKVDLAKLLENLTKLERQMQTHMTTWNSTLDALSARVSALEPKHAKK